MSDYVPNANQEEFAEFFDWTDWNDWNFDWENLEGGGGGVEMGVDWAYNSTSYTHPGSFGITLTTLPPYFCSEHIPSDDITAAAPLYNVNTSRLLSLEQAQSSRMFVGTRDQEPVTTLVEDCSMIRSSRELTPTHNGFTQNQLERQESLTSMHGPQPDAVNGKIAAVPFPETDVVSFPRAFVCPHKSCQRAFVRKYDRERHLSTKHGQSKPYRCPAFGCFKGQRAPTFARFDKLTDHMYRVHDQHTLFQCPYGDCGAGLMSLSLSAIHFKRAHWRTHPSRTPRGETTILWMAKKGHLSCPITGCNTFRGSIDRLMFHLKWSHGDAISGNSLALSVSHALNNMDIFPTKSDCGHGTSPGFVRGTIACDCLITDLFICCPICGPLPSGNGYSFRHLDSHLWETHPPSQPEHLADLRLHREAILGLHPRFGEPSVWDPVWEDIAHVVPRKKPTALEDLPAL